MFWSGYNQISYVPSSVANDSKILYKWSTTEKASNTKIKERQDLTEDFVWYAAVHKETVYTLKNTRHYSLKGEASNLESVADYILTSMG